MTKNRLNKLENWRVTLLPNPKRHSQAKALGLCGGFAVGCSEAQSNSRAQWWYQGIPREVTFPSQKQTGVRGAQGDRIAGWWENGTGSKKGAAVWHMQSDGTLTAQDLHPAHYAWTCALDTGGGAVAGYGQLKSKAGTSQRQQALLWQADGTLIELPVGDRDEGIAQATDGQWAVGWMGATGRQRAALWQADGSEVIELNPPFGVAMARAVRDGEQVGEVWITGADRYNSLAALWHGSADSFVDLTPPGFTKTAATGCAAGFQVGYGHTDYVWIDQSVTAESHAFLWAGSVDALIDLNTLLPEPWNMSAAWAIEVEQDVMRIVGEAQYKRYQGIGDGDRFKFEVGHRAVIWEAHLKA